MIAESSSMAETKVLYTEDFDVLGLVGSGKFGKVYLIEHRPTHKQFARKDVDLSRLSDEAHKNAVREVEMMKKAKHPFILNIISDIETPDYLYIFTEFCFGGDLKKFIASVDEPHLPEKLIICWLVQLTEALQFLHDKRMLHRDIKPDNIYLSDEGDIKLGDFGISRQLEMDESLATTFAGTPCYMSPEVLSQKGYNSKTDIWSLGCVIYELATSRRAFQINNLAFLIFQVVYDKTPTIPKSYSQALVDLNWKMMVKDPENRPSADDILRDQFIIHFRKLRIKPMDILSQLSTPSVADGKVRQKEDIRPVNRATGPFRMPVKYLDMTESQRSQPSTSSTATESVDSMKTVTGFDTIVAKPGSKNKKNKTEKKMPDFESDMDDDSMITTLMSTLTACYSTHSSSQLATERRHELIMNNIRQIQKICAVGIGEDSLCKAYGIIERAKDIQELEGLLKGLLKERYSIYQPYIIYLRILEAPIVQDGGKRKHVETERMKEFKANLKDHKDKKRHCTYPGCGKTFTSIPGLKYHQDTHSPVKLSFTCNSCQRSFRSNNGLKYHYSRCKSCNQSEAREGGGDNNNNNTEFRRSTRTSPLSITVSEQCGDMKPRIIDDNRLRDLAIIATGPSSPLLQNTCISFTDRLETGRCSRTVKRALDLSCKPKVENKPGLILSQLDQSAVITLSNMAKRKYGKQSNVKPPTELQITTKVKRPMNGFLIFAKRKRLFYKEKFPNKDNRAISTLLGEKWKSLCHKKKEIYKEEAKQLSENLLKQHPDCWKRKRS